MPSRAIPSLLVLALSSALASPSGARTSAPVAVRGSAPVFGAQAVGSTQQIDVNQISMIVTNQGSLAYNQAAGSPGFEYPKGSGKTAIFAAGPWLGAMVGGQLRVAVSEYSDEYRPGTIVGGLPDDPHRPEYKVYKLDRVYANLAERDAVLADYDAGAVPYGAPPVSVLGDGSLSILGDQMLWCVFNDADPTYHQSGIGQTAPLGVEVQLTAFAFAAPGPAGRTVFLRYKFLNKGANLLQDLYLGMWSDPDLGGFVDDLVGGDPARALGYVYNGPNVDEQYGVSPPAVGIDLLDGPGALGMNAFTRYVNGGDPADALGVYRVLQGLLPSGAPIIDPTSGLPTTFEVTGDPVAGTGWLDDPPSDRRMTVSSGPLTLAPGESLDATYAIVVGQGSNRLSSILGLRCDDDAIQAFHDRGFALPLPPEAECGAVVNCPRPAFYWYDQFAGQDDDFTPAQLAEIAQRVDAASLYLPWNADPVARLRGALDPDSATTPETQALRHYAALLCNVAVSSPVLLPANGPRILLEAATPISCPGLAAQSVQELAGTAGIGLSDAAYLDLGPNPAALVGVNGAGLPLWDGGAGYAADLFGSSIPNGTNAHTVEIRFTGGATGQYAYRYLRTFDGNGVRVYLIQDYVPVPFQVWDVDDNVQLNAAFLENAGPPPSPNMNGMWDPDESDIGGREILWVMDSPYSGDGTPDPNYFNDPDLTDVLLGNLDHRYVMWPRRIAAGAVIDDGDLFRFTWGGIIPGPSVDVMLHQLAALDPGDPARTQGYADITACLGDINNGIGIGVTCDRPTPVLISLFGAEATPDGVTLQWHAGGTPATRLQVERRETEAAWTTRAEVAADGRGMITYVDAQVVPGRTYDYRLRIHEGGGILFAGETSVAVPLRAALSLGGFHPNPAGRTVQLAFSLVSRAPATLSVYDVTGRRVLTREVGALGPGAHVLPLDRGGTLPSGVYLLHLEQGGRSVTRRAVALR